MCLQNQPFIGLTCSLSIGVFIGYFWSIPLITVVLSFLFLLLGLIACHRVKSLRLLFNFFVLLIIGVFGVTLIHFDTRKWEQNQLIEHYNPGKLMLVQLLEVGDLKKEWVKCTARVDSLYLDSTSIEVHENVVIFFQHPPQHLSAGDQYKISSPLEWIENKGNPGEFDAAHYWNSKGFRLITFAGEQDYHFVRSSNLSFWNSWLNQLHTVFKHALMKHLDAQEEAVALALVLGDKSLLSKETTTSFMNTGALHVLAVSGLHVGLIMQILLTIFSQFSRWITRYQALVIIVIMMWIYATLTGMSSSVLRAVFMFSVFTIGELLGKSRDNLNILFFTAFVLILFDPLTLFDIGFQLSFTAMLGIFLFYPSVRLFFQPRNSSLKWFWEATAIGFAAQLMTTPLSLYYFHQFPNYFLLANTGLMLTSGLILGIGIALFAFSNVPILGWMLGKFLYLLITCSLYFLQWVESLPGAVATGFNIPITWVILASFGTIVLFKYYSLPIIRRLGYFGVFGLLSFLLINRYQRLSIQQVVIFNYNQPVILWKNRDRITCLYDAKFAKLDKIKRLIQAYAISFPGQIYYYSLRQHNFTMNADGVQFFISADAQKINLKMNNKSYFILKKEMMHSNENTFTVAMPWLVASADYHLKDGAFIIPLR